MFHTIMVPLDGSPLGENALPLALAIARRSGASVELVNVCSPLGPNVFGGGLDAPLFAKIRQEQLCDRANSYLTRLAEHLSRQWEVQITTNILTGDPAGELTHYVQTSGIDLVVMTTHGYGPLKRAWMGSVTDALMRHLSVPLLLVRPHAEALDVLDCVNERPLEMILVPLDGSALAEQVLKPVAELAATMDARITLLEAIQLPAVEYVPAAPIAMPDDYVLARWRAEALAYLEGVAEPLRCLGLEVHTRVVYGPPALAIIDDACEHDASLIAMSTHGRGGVERLLLGSVADKVVRGATVSVLIQRPDVSADIIRHSTEEARSAAPVPQL